MWRDGYRAKAFACFLLTNLFFLFFGVELCKEISLVFVFALGNLRDSTLNFDLEKNVKLIELIY